MTPEKQTIFLSLNHDVSLVTLILGIFLLVWIIGLFFFPNKMKSSKAYSCFSKYALPFGFVVALVTSLVTLYYSDYLGILPCGLCWFQRVALYSMVFILGTAWYRKDRNIFHYILSLSIFGEIISLYHHYLQMGYNELLPCPVVSSTVDCAKPTFIEFGFITFPMMSVILFLLFILLSMIVIKGNKA